MCWSLVLEIINKYVLYIKHCSPNVKTTKICASEVIQSSFPCLVFSRIYLSVKMAPSKLLHSVPVAMDITCFVVPLIPRYWTSGDACPGFQSQGRSLTCMLHHLHVMDSLNSPLVQHLLIS